MLFEHYLLLIIAFPPLIQKFLFWLYVIQLKEYRWDRFKDYIKTPQGNSALINIWTVIEFPLFLISFLIFINSPFEIIVYNVMFVFLLIQNLFVFRKLIKGKILHPKLTGRLLLTILIIVLGLIFDVKYILDKEIGNIIYSYILFMYLFAPIVIFFCILLTLPVVNYFKNKKINKAIEKSKKNTKTIKIGITGSYGKSSVKEFLSSILEQDGKTLKTPENINTELGVTNIILKHLNNTYKYFVAEMGAYKIGEIKLLGKIVNHKYGFLTAIGNQHLGLFGSKKNIVNGKLELCNCILKNNGILYVNWDNSNIKKAKFNNKLNIIKYGKSNGSDAIFKILSIKNAITEFSFEYKKYKTTFETGILGEHNIINITGVIAFCYDIGLNTTSIKKYIKNIKTPKNTLNVIKTSSNILIDDTYNLSEASLFTGLNVLNSFKGKKTLILDDILELGKISKEFHFDLGRIIAKKYPKISILYVGVNYKSYFVKGLIEGGYDKALILKNTYMIDDKSTILFEGRSSKKYLDKLK